MKKTESISITDKQVHAKFTARKAHIEIKSVLNKGISINSRFKSEQTSIGINDNYLASVTYMKKTFPAYMIGFVAFLLLGILFSLGSGSTDSSSEFYDDSTTEESDASGEVVLEVILYIFFGLSGICLFLYFYTRIARISFRLADEQDYDILLSSSAVQDSDLMQKFIQKILMNSMNVEDDSVAISFDQSAVIQQPIQVTQQPQPVVMQQPQQAMQQPQQAVQQPQQAVQQPQQAMQQPFHQPYQ